MLFAGIHPLCRVCDIPLVDISHKTGIGFVNRNGIAIILVARLLHKRRRKRLEGCTPEEFRSMSLAVSDCIPLTDVQQMGCGSVP